MRAERPVEIRVFPLVDGRELAWAERGEAEGIPVIAFHGSPGTGHDFDPLHEVAATKGVRLIAVDRPGYGHSTFDPARTYESFTSDVSQLADHLRLDRFGVIGWSSGGPNAAGCARFLADRLVGSVIVSGPAPPDASIATTKMSRGILIWQRLGVVAPRVAGALFGSGLRQGQRSPDKALAWMLRNLPPTDVAVIERPEIRASVLANLARPVAATAGRAATQDLLLESRPWGFALRDIAVPVHVWHGDADRNVAVANARYQAEQIPHATLHEIPDEGHWVLHHHFEEIVDALIA
jgi:pimeloyl-ACP methyl ester carboxylesterase